MSLYEHIYSLTMYVSVWNGRSFGYTFTYVQKLFRAWEWLESAAPHRGNTKCVSNKTYRTLASLLREGWGAFLAYAYPFLHAHGSAGTQLCNNCPETLLDATVPALPDLLSRPEASRLPFSAINCYNFSFMSQSASLNSTLWSEKSKTQMPVCSHSFSPSSCYWGKWSHWCHSTFNSSIAFGSDLIMTFATTAGTVSNQGLKDEGIDQAPRRGL